ncbi:MAG: hypothetical protein HY876_03895 [Coriobacteriales bacterium]|nr:hypothetical protein [Coriobacteriales bacterium]
MQRNEPQTSSEADVVGRSPGPDIGPDRSLESLNWPLLAALLLLGVVLSLTWTVGSRFTGGAVTYVLDDAYIHMALAKNLAFHGVLGVTPHEFTSASSSPLWTLVLASAFKLLGAGYDVVPLWLTVACAVALLAVADRLLARFGLSSTWRFAGLAWIVVGVPMTPVVFGGMEHPLQLVLDLAFVGVAAFALAATGGDDRRRLTVATLLLTPLAASVRYEGVALGLIVAAAFWLRRRWLAGTGVAVLSVAPVAAWGWYSVAHGGYFLPNSVVVKGATAGIGQLFSGPGALVGHIVGNIRLTYPTIALGILCAMLTVLAVRRDRSWNAPVVFAGISGTMALTHLILGDVGWFYRYQAYLFVLLGLSVLVLLSQAIDLRELLAPKGRWVLAMVLAVALLAGYGVSRRSVTAMRLVPLAMHDIFEQHVQVARFLQGNPQYDSVVVNDIGAVSFYNDDIRVLDVWSLGERHPNLAETEAGQLVPAAIERKARIKGSKLAIVHGRIVDVPNDWVRVASWTLPEVHVAADSEVDFYAVPPSSPEAVRDALRRYAERLPADVHVVSADFP